MTDREQYAPSPASAAQFFRFWSAHVDALERHLSANTWALAAVTVVVIAYQIARIAIPAVLNGVVPHVVRTVLNLIGVRKLGTAAKTYSCRLPFVSIVRFGLAAGCCF